MTVEPLAQPLERELQDALVRGLGACPDLAFAHLAQVRVEGREGADQVLFVWLVPAALRSVRMALNLVSEVVAGVLPPHRYLDVVILNSAPDLLASGGPGA